MHSKAQEDVEMIKEKKKLLWILVAALVVGLFAPSMIVSASSYDDDWDDWETFQFCGGENDPT